MAGTSPPPYRLALLCIYYTLVFRIHLPCASATSFALNFSTIATSPCGTDLKCRGDASFAKQVIELTRDDISRGSGDSQGLVWYASPVPLWDAATAEVASFTTTFAFKISLEPDSEHTENDNGTYNIGDGMAFFLAPYPTSVFSSGGGGGYLGLFNGSNSFNATGDSSVVAVEFNTYQNWGWDDGAQRIGIDVNSTKSKAYDVMMSLEDGKIDLASDVTMTATIDYNSQTNILAVDLNICGVSYQINHTVDLESLLPDNVAVGFSAATGKSAELHRISFWSLHSTLDETTVAPAPASQPHPADPSLQSLLPESVAVGFSAATGKSVKLRRVSFWSLHSTLEEIAAPAPQPHPDPADQSPPLPPAESEPSTKSPHPDPADQSPPPPPVESQSPPLPPVESKPSTKLRFEVVVAPVLAVFTCATVGLLLWLWQKRRKHVQPKDGSSDDSTDEQHGEADFEREVAGPRRYHYRELSTATGDFSDENRLGRGGFGSVYHGNIVQRDGDIKQVAVKKFSSETSSQGRKEFEAEVKIISRLRHRNLVKLLGWCDSAKGLLLVYEFVPQGSLDKHIHDNSRLLTWSERYKIILGLGSALRYLHREWDQCVVHGDIKPSNIMLDSSYNTKLGDFGLARLADHGSGPRTTMNIVGTAGYIDPDFVNTFRRSTESDVYSFGIVLLEIVSGKPAMVQEPPFVLVKWVWSLYSQGKTMEAADERLRGDDAADERQMERALVVGLWCARHDPAQRPSILDAMHVLQSADVKLPVLPPHMYKLATLPSVDSVGESGPSISGSSFSSGVRSSATTPGTMCSSDSFPH